MPISHFSGHSDIFILKISFLPRTALSALFYILKEIRKICDKPQSHFLCSSSPVKYLMPCYATKEVS